MSSPVKLVADHLRKVEVRSPAELIIEQLRDLIVEGVLKPGQRLPSERIMAERFDVSRGIVREALRKLEFYGVLRTLPQSGTVLENFGATTLASLLENLLDLPSNDFETLGNARLTIEPPTAALAARNATAKQIKEIRRVHENIAKGDMSGQQALEENMLLHLRIAEAAGNAMIRSFISQLEPEVMRHSIAVNAYRNGRMPDVIAEHEAIVSAIETHDPEAAAAAMAVHLETAIREDASLFAESGDDFTEKPVKRRRKEK